MKNFKEELTEIVKRYTHDTTQARKILVRVKLNPEGIGSISYLKGKATDKYRGMFKDYTPAVEGSARVYADLEDTTSVCYYITDENGIMGEPYNKSTYAYVPYRKSDLDIRIVRDGKLVFIAKSHNLGHGVCADPITEYSNHVEVDFPVADAELKNCLSELLHEVGVEHGLI